MNQVAKVENGKVTPAGPGRVGQATTVEQARAIAEVQGAVYMAREFPRHEEISIAKMREGCGQKRLAERAFFRFPRGGATVSGESVHLARELARCWGNIDYGVKELRRDDQYGQSEMLAFAWDLENNTRSEVVFVVPHMRDKKGGPEKLIDMRDVYENNANQGARRLRECIFSVLPPWFKEEAKEICHKTIEHGGGKPLPQRIADSLKAFEEFDISKTQLEKKMGRATANWTARDVAQLGVIYKSIERGEINKEEEFPREGTVTADEIKKQANGAAQEPPDAQADAGTDDPPEADDAHQDAPAPLEHSTHLQWLLASMMGIDDPKHLETWRQNKTTIGYWNKLDETEGFLAEQRYGERLRYLKDEMTAEG